MLAPTRLDGTLLFSSLAKIAIVVPGATTLELTAMVLKVLDFFQYLYASLFSFNNELTPEQRAFQKKK